MKEYIKLTPEQVTAIVEIHLLKTGELKSNQYIDGMFEDLYDGKIVYAFNPETYKN